MTNEPNENPSVNAQLYFAVLPEWVLYLPISANAVRVYCVLRRFADNQTGECFPSRRLLAMKARVSVQTLDRCVKELVEHHAITVRPRKNNAGDWSSNLYTVMSYPQNYSGVAKKLGVPLLTDDETGSPKTRARTRPITNQKQELRNYNLSQQQNASQGAVWFHLGKTLSEVQELAVDKYGEVRQETITTFLELCEAHNIDPEVGKCSQSRQKES